MRISDWSSDVCSSDLPQASAEAAPAGYALVPIEPTETMVIAGFESVPDEHFSPREAWDQYQTMSGCQQAAHRAKLCWAAMLAAAAIHGPVTKDGGDRKSTRLDSSH